MYQVQTWDCQFSTHSDFIILSILAVSCPRDLVDPYTSQQLNFHGQNYEVFVWILKCHSRFGWNEAIGLDHYTNASISRFRSSEYTKFIRIFIFLSNWSIIPFLIPTALKQIPPCSEFQAPIHIWLTLGLAKCTAVMELANSSPSSPVLQASSIEPAVKQVISALHSSLSSLQDAALHGAMFLLHTALLIRTQPHQQQLQQHSPPTGSPLLNDLYSQVSFPNRFLVL